MEGQDYRILMPDSENPHKRLSSWRSWLGQYGRFLAGEPPGSAKDADRIRQYVLAHVYRAQPGEKESTGRSTRAGREHGTQSERGVAEHLPGSRRTQIPEASAGSAARAGRRRSKPGHGFSVRSERSHRMDRSALDQLREIGFSLSVRISGALPNRERDGRSVRRPTRRLLRNECRPRMQKPETTKPSERPFSRYSRPQRRTVPWFDGRPRTQSPSSIPGCSVSSMQSSAS